MKRITAIVGLSLALASFSLGQGVRADRTLIEERLITLEKESWEAWKNRDGKFFQGFLSDDYVELGFGGPATKAQVVAVVGSPICTVKSYAVDKFKVTIFDAKTRWLHIMASRTPRAMELPFPVRSGLARCM